MIYEIKVDINSLGVLLYSCLGGLFHTRQVREKAKLAQEKIAKKCCCNIFRYLKKHAITESPRYATRSTIFLGPKMGTFGKSGRFRTKKNGTSSGQIKILRPFL